MSDCARRLLMTLLAALLAGLGLMAYAAERSTLNTTFEVEPERIVATGTLTDAAGKAIRKAEILGSVDGDVVATATTRGNGRFEVVIAMPGGGTPGTTYRIKIEFAGNDKYAASSSLADYAVPAANPNPNPGDGGGGGGGKPPPPATTTPPPRDRPSSPAVTSEAPPPPPEPKPAVLTVTSLPDSVQDASTLSLTGTLATAAGEAIGGAGIVVSDARGEVADSYTLTNAGGSFSTLYEVPTGISGPLSLTLSFGGMEGVKRVEAVVTTTVEQVDVATATPSASPTATVEAPATVEATATPTPTASAPDDGAVDAQPPAQPWFLVSLIGVGGVALLTVAALVFRGMNAPRADGGDARRSSETGGLDFLDEELDKD